MIVIVGKPATKKNSGRIVGRGKRKWLLPSDPYVRWENAALPQLRIAWAGRDPIAHPVSVRATFYRERNTGDMNNYFSALADALQKARIVVDDKWIMSWDGSRLAKDAKRPRIELEIEPLDVLAAVDKQEG